MPIFEYACKSCGQHFEHLTRENATPTCPACHGAALEKQLSVFAVQAGGTSRSGDIGPSPCGSCGDPRGPGACSMN